MPKLKKDPAARPILYPTYEHLPTFGERAITMEQAKQILGWSEDPAQAKELKLGEPAIVDRNNVNVWLVNNQTNRSIYIAKVDELEQEHLNRRWSGPNGNGKSVNGECLLIGKYGSVLNGQHSLVSLVFAEQTRQKEPDKWKAQWPGPVVMDKPITRGIDEDDAVVNTMDTCKPRSAADVIYRSEYFRTMKPEDRKTASRMLDFAVRLLWERTGAKLDPYHPRRTNPEFVDFIERHPGIIKVVKHILGEDKLGEDKNGAISGKLGYISSGTAAGLFYLMASSATDPKKYLAEPIEKNLNWDNWEKAQGFWVDLAAKAKKVEAVRLARRPGSEGEHEGFIFSGSEGSGSANERKAYLCAAWLLYAAGEKITEDTLVVDYKEDEAGDFILSKHLPPVGGIDRGIGKEETTAEDTSVEESGEAEPTAPKLTGAELAEKLRKMREANKVGEPKGLEEEINAIREQHPGYMLLFKTAEGLKAWGPDADEVARVLKFRSTKIQHGMPTAVLKESDLDAHLSKLRQAGVKVATCETNGKETVVTHLGEEPAAAPIVAKPGKKPAPKPKAVTS